MSYTRHLYAKLASLVQARESCMKVGNSEWLARHTERIERLVSDFLPSGSGFDSGTQIDLDLSTPDRLVFTTSFHHMDDNGTYDGWTDHTVIVRPSFTSQIHVRVTGRDRNEIKDYISETFYMALITELESHHA